MKKTQLLKPIEPMLAVYAAGDNVYDYVLECHNGTTFAELKYDGYRLQLHKIGDHVKGFTRSLNEVPVDIYTELTDAIKKLPDCVLDCELNGGIGHAGFKVVQKRFRLKQTDIGHYMKSVDTTKPLELMVFDVLFMEGTWTMNLPLSERRKYTESIDEKRVHPGIQWNIDSSTKLEELFEDLSGKKQEGIVCKNPSSLYVPGDKHTDWLKLKRFETLDLTILGVYIDGTEISQLLCGSYNNETNHFETLAKVNAKRDGLGKRIAHLLKNKFVKDKPASIVLSANAKADDLPDFYIDPFSSIVIEIKAMNIHYSKNWHSCGSDGEKSYSLRIAWAKGIRDDKSPIQATTLTKVAELYKIQEGA